ncbi:uncharacterized protein LOC124491239 [Dermatophagoides farinae]|uniref:uncharacterized protein LOC124491239 n=1 Tax=Dermatophagoides farinae TaxID=6954 RepID=UPI003F6160F0
MQSNTTIIYPASFLFRKWSLIIIISLDLMIIFYTTFALIGRLQILENNSNDITGNNYYSELYHNHHIHGSTLLIHKNLYDSDGNNNDDDDDDDNKWINQTSLIMEMKPTQAASAINPFNLFPTLAFDVENPTTMMTTTTTTTISTETDTFDALTSNNDDDDDDDQIDYDRYHYHHEQFKNSNNDHTNSSISSESEHPIWFEMFEHRIYQRPKLLAQVMANFFAYIVCLIGLIGVLRENYFLTTIYAWFGCFSLASSIMIYVWTWAPELFGKIMSNLLFLILLFMYLRDLATIRLQITENIIIVA